LKREAKAFALNRMEEAARTVNDYEQVLAQWNHNEENDARRYRDHEVMRTEYTFQRGYSDGMIFPVPISHPAWREAMRGDFLSMIYDNAEESWQLVEDKDIALLLKSLTHKQKEVLYDSVVLLCTAERIGYYQGKTDRAVRKLLAVTLERIRANLALIIRKQIESNVPDMTLNKRKFLERYEKETNYKQEGEDESF
jgi:hypothetical protein